MPTPGSRGDAPDLAGVQVVGVEHLKEVVVRTLESLGVLSSFKANLRATMFAALNAGDAERDRLTGRGGILDTDEGALALACVVDFLRHAELKHTLKVLESEVSHLGLDAFSEGKRDRLPGGTGTASDDKTPALVRMLRSGGSAAAPIPPTRAEAQPAASPPLPPSSHAPHAHAHVHAAVSPKGEGGEGKEADDMPTSPAEAGEPQASVASLYSEATEEIEEILSFVEEESMLSVGDAGGEEGEGEGEETLGPVDSATLGPINSALSATDRSGDLDSEADEVEIADVF